VPGVTAAAGVFAHLDRAPSAAAISPAGSEEIRIARFITTPRDAAATAGLGDKQTQAKLGRVEIDEVVVAFGPPAG
jgi:hypothetical protein